MKVGVFSPYFQTFGGGERYVLTAAEYFLSRGDKVDIFWSGNNDIEKIKQRFDIDLSQANFRENIFSSSNLFHKTIQTLAYDLIFILSDGSIPFTLAKKNILHFQQPFHYQNQKTIVNKLKLLNYQAIVCNSQFTKGYIDKSYGVKSLVLYPPVDTSKFSPGKKTNIILSVGRFFGPSNAKKQEIMIETFKKMKLKNWKLILIGAVTPGSQDFLEQLKNKITGYPIDLIPDSSFSLLKKYYSSAKIYWHATGFGQDLEKFPERAEHFGITTVEAMASGCAPVVFNGGGQQEIITEGMDGFFWKTTAELIKKTLTIINNPGLFDNISRQGITRSKDFSKNIFFQKLNEIA